MPTRALWITTALLAVSALINYFDRGNLSVAAPLLKQELALSPVKLGQLLSAFFWSYAIMHLAVGWLVDRYNQNWILAAGFFLWSAATATTGLATSFVSLFFLRLLLGVGESVAYPAYSKILAVNYTESQRGMANSLIEIGSKFGPALGTLAGGLMMARFGWRPFFVIIGLASLLWIPLWIRWMPRGPAAAGHAVQAPPTFGKILCHRSAWATFAGLFCSNYFWYFLLTWLPYYLVNERHFSMQHMAVVGALPFICSAASTTVAGWLSYRAIVAGVSPTVVRKTCTGAGLAGTALIVFVPAISDVRVAMAILMLASASYGVYTSSHWAITQTIAGPLAAGRWSGLQNFVGNMAGVVAAALTGFIVERTGLFFLAFAAAASFSVLGALIYAFGIRAVEPARWGTSAVAN